MYRAITLIGGKEYSKFLCLNCREVIQTKIEFKTKEIECIHCGARHRVKHSKLNNGFCVERIQSSK